MRLAVLGVGLIGGSVGLAARERARADVVGWDPDPACSAAPRPAARSTAPAGTLAEAVGDAEVVVVAAPVGALPGVVGAALAATGPDTVVTDVGSTKRAVVAAHPDDRFVGGHPLAGAETSGVEHARADLFDGATWYLTPTAGTSGVLFERLHRFLSALGARPCALDADRHDALLAAVSHLPHVLANVLVTRAAAALAREEERMPAAGPCFRDAARVAGASTRHLAATSTSPTPTRSSSGSTRRSPACVAVRDALADRDGEAIAAWNEPPPTIAAGLLEAGLAGGPVHELRASVPNEPGVVARLALELGRAGRQHHRHGPLSRRRQPHRLGRAVDRRRRAGGAGPRSSWPRQGFAVARP